MARDSTSSACQDAATLDFAERSAAVTPAIGLWLLPVGLAIIVFGTYAPRKAEPIAHPARHLNVALLHLALNIALVIIHPSFPTGSFLYVWLYPVLVVGIPASVVNVLGAFISLQGAG